MLDDKNLENQENDPQETVENTAEAVENTTEERSLGDAIEKVNPKMVDIMSGASSARGKKDIELVKKLVDIVKERNK